MFIPPYFLQCIAFLYAKKPDARGRTQPIPGGSAFLVSMKDKDGAETAYAITCRHVLEACPPHHNMVLRLNKTDGSPIDLPTEQEQWICHQETDLAIVQIPLPCNLWCINNELFVRDEELIGHRPLMPAETTIGVGDEVFCPGLFQCYPGKLRNYPVVRFGNIALMPPEEKIPIEITHKGTPHRSVDMDAYLVEMKSWGGQSGSPVFVHLPVDRHLGFVPGWDAPTIKHPVLLLGVIQGHWDISRTHKIKAKEYDKLELEAAVEHNAGMAVVIPAKYIQDLLMEDIFVKEREEAEKERMQNRPRATPDSSFPKQSFTKSDFQHALKKVSKRKSAPGSS